MPDRVYLHPIDPELIPGARNAIDVCLPLKPEARITILTDEAPREIAAALQTEVERSGSEYSVFSLGHHARRHVQNSARHGIRSRPFAEIEMVEDERDHPERQMGQSSWWRNFHVPQEHERRLRRRRRGRRLSLRTLRRPERESAHD